MNHILRLESMLRTLAVGDAMGKICSKYTTDEVCRIYGGPITSLVAPIRKTSSQKWYKGAVTDDTILTLLVADSLIAKNGFDRCDIAARMIACDPRGGTQIKKLQSSNDVHYVASDGETNGAAIRTLSLTAIARSYKHLIDMTHSLTTLTHNTPESLSSSITVAIAQYTALHGEPCLIQTRRVMEAYCPEYLETKFMRNLIRAQKIAEQYSHDDLCSVLESEIGFSKFAWTSVPSALAIGHASNNAYRAIIHIIHRKKQGGDLDTVASIAGSILGSHAYCSTVNKLSRVIEKNNAYDFTTYARRLGEIQST